LVAHATPQGRLVDSQRDELPSGFFRALPPSVGFIAVFSCDSTNVVKAYGLDQLPGREVVVVQMQPPFSASESTPLELFKAWAKKAEKEGLIEARESGLPETECQARLEGLELEQGRISLEIGGLPVGVWSQVNESEALAFPCAWIAAPATVAIVQPTQLSLGVTFGSGNRELVLTAGSGARLGFANRREFRDASGGFRSLIFSGLAGD
jgi:hypothetical protein